jgi:hypothetical protein
LQKTKKTPRREFTAKRASNNLALKMKRRANGGELLKSLKNKPRIKFMTLYEYQTGAKPLRRH